MSALKKKILEYTEQNNIDYSKLERKAGLTKNFISNIILEKSKNPGIDSIIKLANALEISIDELVGNQAKEESQNIEITNIELWTDIALFILKKLRHYTEAVNSLELFIATTRIYSYSLPQNKTDIKFATWYLENYLLKGK